jgi:hypothetical protein
LLRSCSRLVALVHFPKFIQLIFVFVPHLLLAPRFIIGLTAQSRLLSILTN